MRKFVLTALAITGLAGPAFANDTIDAMIGATVVYTYPDGTTVSATFSDDGTYTTDSVGGGSWTRNGDDLCITTDGGDSGCTYIEPGKGAGDSWDAVDAFGNDVNITIG